MPSSRADIQALHSMLEQVHLIVSSNPIPPGGRERATELLAAALVLTKDLSVPPRTKAAAALGAKGGKATSAKLGPEHYRRMAAARKTRGGGRPQKNQGQ